jgi:hypothetical protein
MQRGRVVSVVTLLTFALRATVPIKIVNVKNRTATSGRVIRIAQRRRVVVQAVGCFAHLGAQDSPRTVWRRMSNWRSSLHVGHQCGSAGKSKLLDPSDIGWL